MRNLVALIPLVMLLFGQIFYTIASASIIRREDNVVVPIVKRSTKIDTVPVDAYGDGELMQFAETHLFRPLLRNRIRKSSQSFIQLPNLRQGHS